MSSATIALQEEFGATIAALAGALAAGDDKRFFGELDALVERRERRLFGDLRKLTSDLQSALERFSIDSRLVDLAEKEVPDARLRLDHVLRLTDEAAHRTMDLVEQCGPLADRAARQAEEVIESWRRFRSRNIAVEEFHDMVRRMDGFLEATRADMGKVRGNLAEVLLAQGYQDLSGQIIRGVMKLVGELEVALVELVRLSKGGPMGSKADEPDQSVRGGFGPTVPGIDRGPAVSDQEDVDALLSGLGM
jgi:chemotaxis protein CheZ